MGSLLGMSTDKKSEGDRHKSRRVVRLPDDLHQAISRLADRHERPIAREVKLALVAWLRQHGEWPAEGEAPEPKKGRPKKGGA